MRLSIVAVGLWLGGLAAPASAGFVTSIVGPGTVAAGTSSYFDVLLTNEGGPAQSLSGYNVQLTIDGAAGVTFTAVTDESPNYVFASHALGILAFPGPSLVDWSDLLDLPFQRNLDPDQTVSLGRVFFDVAPGSSGPFEIQFESDLMQTAFSSFTVDPDDPDDFLKFQFYSVPFESRNGGVTVLADPTLATPAPPAVVLALVGLATAPLLRGRAARRAQTLPD